MEACQLAEGVGADGRPEAEIDVLHEPCPGRHADVALELEVPLCRRAVEVQGRSPDLLLLHGAVPLEEVLALVDPRQRIRLAVEVGCVAGMECAEGNVEAAGIGEESAGRNARSGRAPDCLRHRRGQVPRP